MVWRCETSGCCGSGLCWRGLTAMPGRTRTSGIGAARWRNRLASKATSPGPRRFEGRMTVDVACGSCGTGLRESARFCGECGAPTAVSRDTAEYKQVTVLFADVVRSMDIAAALDAERLREIMTEPVGRPAAGG